MSKILALTGLTGKSGGVLAEQIAENIEEVRGQFPDGVRILLRPTSKTEKLEALLPEAEKYTGNFTDINFLKRSLKSVDTLVHVAGIHWSREIAEAAAFNHVRRLILVHTTGIYSKYKAAGEEYRKIDAFVNEICKQNNIILTILRPTMIYGNVRDNNIISFIKMVDKLPIMPVVNGGRYGLQPVHYADLGRAYYQVLIHENTTANKEFILSGGAPILLRDMLSVIGKNLGKNVKVISCPFPIAYAGAWLIYYLSFKKKDYREKVQRLCEPRTFPHSEATAAFGYKPMTFEAGIVDEIEEYKKLKEGR